MLNKKIIITAFLSIAFTIISPFIFHSYFEEKPASTDQTLLFGAPFPFAEQNKLLPDQDNMYPVEVKFESPFELDTNFKIIPFLLSFLCYYLLIFSIYSIATRFFIGKPKPGEEPQ